MPIGIRQLQEQLVQHDLMRAHEVRDLGPDDALSPALIDALKQLPPLGESDHQGMHWPLSHRVRDLTEQDLAGIISEIGRPRCGVPDGPLGGLQVETFGSPGGRWQSGLITVSINPSGCNLPGNSVIATVSNAFAQWQAVGPFFTFTQTPAGGAIQARFGGAEIGQGFGTQGGVLANGSYPPSGQLNFDSAETWTPAQLMSVALHEIGHVLGLSHSDSRASLMYPYDLTFAVIDAETADALRNLYGWAPQIQLGDRATSDRPALGVTGSWDFSSSSFLLHMVWKGVGDDSGIYESELVNNVWNPQRRIAGIGSSGSPALVSISTGPTSKGLMMAWKGVGDDQGLYYSTNAAGDWVEQQRMPDRGSSQRPALADFNGIWMAWKGVHDDQGIYWSTYTGEGWTPQQNVRGVGTSASPALVALGDRLYMFWKGVEGDDQVYYSWIDNGVGAIWQPQRVVAYVDNETGGGIWENIGSSHGPSATVRGNRILLAWKGVPGDQGIYFSLFDGNEFTGQIRIAGVGTSEGPAVCTFGGYTHMTWKGVEGDGNIYWSTL